jgi:hypothetical protein
LQLLVFECQQMVIDKHDAYPGLTPSVRTGGMLDRLADDGRRSTRHRADGQARRARLG